jgi:hypothetical protein
MGSPVYIYIYIYIYIWHVIEKPYHNNIDEMIWKRRREKKLKKYHGPKEANITPTQNEGNLELLCPNGLPANSER